MPDPVQPGDILPATLLQPLAGGPPVRVGPGRTRPQVLVVTHAEPCDDCLAYLRSFEAVSELVHGEKADLIALAAPAWADAARALPVTAVVGEGALLERLAPARAPLVAVADRFGQLFTRAEAGDDHAFLAHDDLLARLLGIGISCPECGVPDVPSGALLPEAGARSGGMTMWM